MTITVIQGMGESEKEQAEEEDPIELGGLITLKGFSDLEPAKLIVVKKIVGTYVRKYSDHIEGFDSIELYVKPVHKTKKSEKHEFHAKAIIDGTVKNTEVTERNFFVGLDKVLKKMENRLRK